MSSRCRQNLKYENFTSSFFILRQKNAPKTVPHVQHDYFSTFSQSYHDWFVALQSPLQSSFFKLPNRENGDSDLHDVNELSFMIWMSGALANVQRRTCAVHACFFFLSQYLIWVSCHNRSLKQSGIINGERHPDSNLSHQTEAIYLSWYFHIWRWRKSHGRSENMCGKNPKHASVHVRQCHLYRIYLLCWLTVRLRHVLCQYKTSS